LHSTKEREGAGAAYLEDALVAGKGLGRRSPSRRRQVGKEDLEQGRISWRQGKGLRREAEGGDEPEALSG